MKRFSLASIVVTLACCAFPLSASAATKFEVTGWLPYWKAASSTEDAIAHITELTEVDPFVYSVGNDGSIIDNGPMDQAPWADLVAAAKANHVRVVPTIMWSNASAETSILENTKSRIALEIAAANIAKQYDGVDIDFENKPAGVRNYFSLFLKGLYARVGQKFVTCDIEARTPIGDMYPDGNIPAGAGTYANDFTEINKYCDRVHIMTYDQQGVDQLLANQAASSSQLYAPVADPAWVSKVIDLTKQTISPWKISVGVPTYGYEYDVTAYSGDEYNYDIMWVFNPGYATQIEDEYNVQPTRNAAGELELTYITTTATSSMPVSSNINNALIAAAAASQYATQLNSHMDFRLLDWPDATSVADKVALAKDLGVRGISIFKIDGGEDPNIWNAIKGLAASDPASGTTASSASALSRDLSIGITGTDVKTLQQILNSDPATQIAASGPGSPGNETTMYGSLTMRAVQKFQSKYGIAGASNPAYGYVGPATRAKLNSILAGM